MVVEEEEQQQDELVVMEVAAVDPGRVLCSAPGVAVGEERRCGTKGEGSRFWTGGEGSRFGMGVLELKAGRWMGEGRGCCVAPTALSSPYCLMLEGPVWKYTCSCSLAFKGLVHT